MAPERPKTHLTAERIQAFLDDALSRDDRAEIQEHATFCGRCHAELETWQLLYSELGELPELSPAPNFRDRVLAGLDTAVPAASAKKRRLGWLRRRAVRAAQHLDPERLQDYVEGLLPAPQMARISVHLEACGGCRGEEEQWRSLIQGIEKLPEMVPSRAFASHVMGQIRIGRLVRPVAARTTRGRALVWAGRLIPRTQKAWAVISVLPSRPLLWSLCSRTPCSRIRSRHLRVWCPSSGGESVVAPPHWWVSWRTDSSRAESPFTLIRFWISWRARRQSPRCWLSLSPPPRACPDGYCTET